MLITCDLELEAEVAKHTWVPVEAHVAHEHVLVTTKAARLLELDGCLPTDRAQRRIWRDECALACGLSHSPAVAQREGASAGDASCPGDQTLHHHPCSNQAQPVIQV